MPKKEIAQELKEEFNKGNFKPSQLKRSKSADDISAIPPLPLINDQLKEKQQEVESLRKQLEKSNTELKATKEQLDNSLFARVEAVKQFGLIYDKLQLVKQELDDTVDQASDELLNQDEQIAKLRTNQQKAQAKIKDLESLLRTSQKDLNLAHRLVELRKDYPVSPKPDLSYLTLALFSLGTVIFTL